MNTGMNEHDNGFVEMLHDVGLPRTLLCDVMGCRVQLEG